MNGGSKKKMNNGYLIKWILGALFALVMAAGGAVLTYTRDDIKALNRSKVGRAEYREHKENISNRLDRIDRKLDRVISKLDE